VNTAIGLFPATSHLEAGHPESPGRLRAVTDLLHSYKVFDRVATVKPASANTDQILTVHDPRMVGLVAKRSDEGYGHLDADTYFTPGTFDSARFAAGTVCTLTDIVMAQEVTNSLALIRPPGHHAERGRVGGFCIFNNVAIAARHLQARHSIRRILIIDFDVHHGNGTQEIFYSDPDILFISVHLYYPFFYPGSGWLTETGLGDGRGKTINVPLQPGSGDMSYGRIFDEIIRPVSERFVPEYLLVSAGFDAHWKDPLASAGLSLSGYYELSGKIVELAEDLCSGRCTIVLEGGYHLEALSFGVLNVVNRLSKNDVMIDPLGPSPYAEPDIDPLIQDLHSLHLLY